MRSYLFVPGNNPSMLQNADIYKADAIIIDLEDAVTNSEKDSARELVRTFLRSIPVKADIIVRINSMDTEHFRADLEMVSNFDIYAIMLPKVNRSTLEVFAKNYNFKIIPIIETALGVVDLEDIIKHELVIGVLLGAEDLATDMGFERTKENLEIFFPRQKLSYYAKAYGKSAIDTPCVVTDDLDVVTDDVLQAKSFGYRAKACIHPLQVSIVNKYFIPSKKELKYAQRVVTSSQNHSGAYSLDGKMIDEPIINRSKRMIEYAKKYGVEVDE